MDALRIAHARRGYTWRVTGLDRIALAAVLSIACAASAGAQVIRVAGTIKDDGDHPIRGAIVTAENPDQAPARLTATSNDRGQFGFIGIRRGTWTFTVEAPGHEPVRFRRQVAAGRQEPMPITLSKTAAPAALPLDGTNAADILQRIDRAGTLASGGDLDGAIAAWGDVLAKAPNLTSAHLQIAALYERKADPDRALAVYRRLLELEPANQRALAAIERLGRRTKN
jgi:tetratricopeptide (TPR) repeat protein